MKPESTWEKFYNAYPVNNDSIWLNNCGTTPASRFSLEGVHSFLEEYSRKGVFQTRERYPEVKSFIINTISELLNCHSDEIGIIHNTSEGMNFISHGLNLKSKDEILLLENEYPSNVYPWEHWEEKGVSIRFIKMADRQDEFFENFIKSLNDNVKVVSISAVHWCTGMPLPLEKIGLECEKRGIELAVDGAQGVGQIEMDLQKLKISFMAFPAWKWLLGPLGLGIIFIRNSKISVLKNIFKGTTSVVDAENYLPYKKEIINSAQRYEFSTSNFTDWVYFKSILKELKEIGFSEIRERLYFLSHRLNLELEKIGFNPAYPGKQMSAILAVDNDEIDSFELHSHLKKKSIITALRMEKVRFSPHIYISPAQIDRVVEVIGTYKDKSL